MTCACAEDLTPLAAALAELLVAGDVLLLSGGLGAGKTTLTQALARALEIGDDQYVSSPSFALVHEYTGRLPVVHMDLYRLDNEEDVEAAGLADFFERSAVCVVEWPDQLGGLAPEERLEILIEQNPPAARRLLLVPRGSSWQQRLKRLAAHLTRCSACPPETDTPGEGMR
ncbi:tRNA (adenosine(37)-N6)-threonylcarbamoyltransferase complex ATPase subunit type 1 TsaE [Desulfobulbus sp.]|uniref:tRNA (adenosine(37)-N6)-threonylcarbamoyltransferase complex ATPase subunit type 1 TsaE n=1 Tax=Desulfobulbus sp. TaxID=895 RepID=UPI00286F7308|nr:tRNA (adenosine(37)-N6)-threonylcarbamoyltransferase complex ATPase subunit type 1 TsaE [Desulfobulbus sp.]